MPRYNAFGEAVAFEPGMEQIERKYFWPFFHDRCKRWMFFVKVCLGVVLVPVKLLMITLTFCIFYVTLAILNIGRKPGEHPTGIRKFLLLWASKICARTLLFDAGVFWIKMVGKPTILPIYKLSELKSKREQKKKNKQGQSGQGGEDSATSETSETKRTRMTKSMLRKLNPAYIFNHTSPVDIPLSVVARGGTFVSKAEVTSIPFMKMICKTYEMVMVDRSDPKSREKTAREIEDKMNDRMHFPLIVYPEGITTNGKCLVNFRPGVFRPGKPVQPVILRYWAPFGELSWDIQQGIPYLLDLLARPFVSVTVKYMPLYEPSSAEKSDAMLFANNVRTAMATEMKVPTYDMCYKDKIAFENYCHGRTTFGECLGKLCEPFRSEIAEAMQADE